MIFDTSRPMAAAIESSGSAVTDVGKYHDPSGPGACVHGDATASHHHQSDAESAADNGPRACLDRSADRRVGDRRLQRPEVVDRHEVARHRDVASGRAADWLRCR